MNRIAAILLLASLGLCIAGLSSDRSGGRTGGSLVVDARSCDFGVLTEKEHATIMVVFRNESNDTAHLLGAAGYCTKQGCLSAKGLPTEIPPGEEVRIEVSVVGYQPGPFSQELPFYSRIDSDSPILVKITGNIAAAKFARPISGS